MPVSGSFSRPGFQIEVIVSEMTVRRKQEEGATLAGLNWHLNCSRESDDKVMQAD